MSHLNKQSRKRLDILTAKQVSGAISLGETIELEWLQRKANPYSPAEVKFHRERRRVTNRLIQALNAYVEFHTMK